MKNNVVWLANSGAESLEAQKKIVREIYVATKKAVSVGDSLDKLLEEHFGITGVKTSINVRYLVDGLTDQEYQWALPTIFGELPVEDLVSAEEFSKNLGDKKVLNIESLPGQYDDVVEWTKQSLMLQTGNQDHKVRTFSTITFEGEISDEDMAKVKKYLINPVDSHDVNLSDRVLLRDLPSAENVKILDGFTELDDLWSAAFIKQYGLAMNVDDLKFAQEYFASKKRNPTVAEIKVLDTYRSDHCRHTTFNTEIGKVEFDINEHATADSSELLNDIMHTQGEYEKMRKELGRNGKPNTLMEVATLYKRYLIEKSGNPNIKNLDESDEINDCSFTTMVEMEDGTAQEWCIGFKNETHNHPTEIEPYGWAATCLGGCIRDPMSGRKRVFQAMRITWAADPTEPISETLAGKLSQRAISQLAAKWFSSYGNQIGIHAWEVREYFHPWYKAKRFEVGYVIAGAPAFHIRREQPKWWDKVIMIWWKTGRDGIGAAAGASKEHTSTSVSTLGAEVQKWNPVEEKKLARLNLDPKFTQYVKRCNDFWAWGVSVAIWELSRGLDIDLDKIPTKYSWLDGTELAISESQERMAIVIGPEDHDEVMKIIQAYNLQWTHVADVTDNTEHPSKDKLIMEWRGQNIVDLDRDFLDMAGAKRKMDMIKIGVKKDFDLNSPIDNNVKKALGRWDFVGAFLENLKRLDVASQKWLGSIFDNSVGASNVLAMHGGKYQITPQMGMVSKIPTFNGVDARTVAISTHGFNPDLASESAYLGAINAIKLAVSKQVALWGEYRTIWMSLQEYFGKLKNDPERWGECYAALLGAFKAQKELSDPAIGGKDSMAWTLNLGQGKEINVPPSVVAFAANMGNIHRIVSSEFKKTDSDVFYFPAPSDRLSYKNMLDKVWELVGKWLVISSSVVEAWGLAATLAKMSLGNKIGFSGGMASEKYWAGDEFLFADELWWIVLEVPTSFATYDEMNKCGAYPIWHTTGDTTIVFDRESISLDEVLKAYTWTHETVHPTKWWGGKVEKIIPSEKAKMRTSLVNTSGVSLDDANADETKRIIECSESWLTKNFNILKWLKPKVLIPVFPGTNSELDTAHKVRMAGMEAVEFIFNNQTPELLMESTRKFAQLLKDTQMVVFPGGFSAGDQPHGSGKFIDSLVRMNIVRDAMQAFFDTSDTLTLGICNGFQALIKLGVFDEGKIKECLQEGDPTLYYNTTWRHMTDQVGLQITSVLSPMMSLVDIGDTFVIPISHGEGRVYMRDKETLERYIKNGQVVMQYLDADGKPTNHYNGSLEGIAALCSPNGRILGMMPHPERSGLKLFQNIPGNHELPIFKSAAKAFGVKRR